MRIKELFNAHGLMTPDYALVVKEQNNKTDSLSWNYLFKLDEAVIIIYRDKANDLADRLDVVVDNCFEESKIATLNFTKALGIASFYIDKAIYSLEGNWLLKHRNQVPNGLIKLFTLWLASKELEDDASALKLLYSYVERYVTDINLLEYQQYKTDEMMQTFLKCLLNLINDVTDFDSLINNKSIKNWDLWHLSNKSIKFEESLDKNQNLREAIIKNDINLLFDKNLYKYPLKMKKSK